MRGQDFDLVLVPDETDGQIAQSPLGAARIQGSGVLHDGPVGPAAGNATDWRDLVVVLFHHFLEGVHGRPVRLHEASLDVAGSPSAAHGPFGENLFASGMGPHWYPETASEERGGKPCYKCGAVR